MKDIVKCRFAHCNHESQELKKSDAICIGKASYYHPDCYKIKEDISTIGKLFSENINSGVVFSQLYSVVNNIIFTKGFSSEYLVFALRYYIEHKIPLNYPQGLYYVIQNKEVKKAWDKSVAIDIKSQMAKDTAIVDESFSEFGYSGPKKQKSISDIFGG